MTAATIAAKLNGAAHTVRGKVNTAAAGVEQATRSEPKPKAKATIPPEQHAAAEEGLDARARMYESINAYMAERDVPLTARRIIAHVVSFAAAFAVGYGVAWLIEPLMLSAAVSGSMFLSVLTVFLALIVSMYIGAKAANAAFDYIAKSTIDQHYNDAKSAAVSAGSWVSGLFSRKPATAK